MSSQTLALGPVGLLCIKEQGGGGSIRCHTRAMIGATAASQTLKVLGLEEEEDCEENCFAWFQPGWGLGDPSPPLIPPEQAAERAARHSSSPAVLEPPHTDPAAWKSCHSSRDPVCPYMEMLDLQFQADTAPAPWGALLGRCVRGCTWASFCGAPVTEQSETRRSKSLDSAARCNSGS